MWNGKKKNACICKKHTLSRGTSRRHTYCMYWLHVHTVEHFSGIENYGFLDYDEDNENKNDLKIYSRTEKGGAGGTHLFVTCPSPLTNDHASLSRERATLLLLIGTRSTFKRSLRFFHPVHKKHFNISSPSCFAVCERKGRCPINSSTCVYVYILYTLDITEQLHSVRASSILVGE